LTGQIRVALVDDQSLVLEGLRVLLETMPSISVDCATTQPMELVTELRRKPVDVVVSDIRMPGFNGFDVVKRLNSWARPIPVILLTTFDEANLLDEAIAVGAKGFLLKGASPEDAATGLTNKEIAQTLGLVEGTVKNYMSDLMIKLDSRDRTQAVIRAIGAGLL